MTSYLVEGVLFVALMVTSWRVAVVLRELRRLRGFQDQYQGSLDASVQALETVRAALEAIRADVDIKLSAVQAPAQPGSGPSPTATDTPADLQTRVGQAFAALPVHSAPARPVSRSAFVPFGASDTARPLKTAASR